ncbi:hypothetical protein ACHAXR_005001 [Thalassiosira sp. AJA248-18]
MLGASAPFQHGLWVISNICSSSDDFHLLVVRSGMNKDPKTGGGDYCRTLPVGFVLGAPKTVTPSASEFGYAWIFARRYDPHTEEISNEPVDELTMKNIVMAMDKGGELGKFVITYDQFMGSASNNNDICGNNNCLPSWDARTSMINAHFLQRRHCISHGDKIIPSSDTDISGDATQNNSTATSKNSENDGVSISYPPIPCIDQTINARRLAQHSGTRIYLSKLSPEKRTQLLFGGDSATESMNAGEYVWNDVLCRYYDRDVDGSISKSGNKFLADVELSFLLFLFLECHSSLEHWRDAISMCSLSTADETNNIVTQHPQFFQKLLSVLYHQLSCIETEFFREVEYSSGENNFMVEALRKLCNACENVGKRKRGVDTVMESLKSLSLKLRHLAHDRFGLGLTLRPSNDDDDDMEIEPLYAIVGEDGEDSHERTGANELYDNLADDDDDEEDGPVMIPYNEIEESIARSSVQSSQAAKRHDHGKEQNHSKEYPLLYAAKTANEDDVMACSRILDEAKDVSLVREAAAYLEEVEACRGGSF